MPDVNFVGANPNSVAWQDKVGALWAPLAANGMSTDAWGQYVMQYDGPKDASGRPVVGSQGNYTKVYYHVVNGPDNKPTLVVGPGQDAPNPYANATSTPTAPNTPYATTGLDPVAQSPIQATPDPFLRAAQWGRQQPNLFNDAMKRMTDAQIAQWLSDPSNPNGQAWVNASQQAPPQQTQAGPNPGIPGIFSPWGADTQAPPQGGQPAPPPTHSPNLGSNPGNPSQPPLPAMPPQGGSGKGDGSTMLPGGSPPSVPQGGGGASPFGATNFTQPMGVSQAPNMQLTGPQLRQPSAVQQGQPTVDWAAGIGNVMQMLQGAVQARGGQALNSTTPPPAGWTQGRQHASGNYEWVDPQGQSHFELPKDWDAASASMGMNKLLPPPPDPLQGNPYSGTQNPYTPTPLASMAEVYPSQTGLNQGPSTFAGQNAPEIKTMTRMNPSMGGK